MPKSVIRVNRPALAATGTYLRGNYLGAWTDPSLLSSTSTEGDRMMLDMTMIDDLDVHTELGRAPSTRYVTSLPLSLPETSTPLICESGGHSTSK